MSNVIHLNLPPRATAIAPEDNTDPHTAAIQGLKKAIEASIRTCGKGWTLNVLRAAIEIDASPNWRERAREMFQKEPKV
jgi:hypothetical protein